MAGLTNGRERPQLSSKFNSDGAGGGFAVSARFRGSARSPGLQYRGLSSTPGFLRGGSLAVYRRPLIPHFAVARVYTIRVYVRSGANRSSTARRAVARDYWPKYRPEYKRPSPYFRVTLSHNHFR